MYLTEAIGVYCDNSSEPYFARRWVILPALGFHSRCNANFLLSKDIKIACKVSLAICILSIIEFYKAPKVELRGQHVLLKMVAFKSVVRISFLEKVSPYTLSLSLILL